MSLSACPESSFRVSAVVPVRLPAPFLNEALQSLAKQSRSPDEIIVVAHGWSADAAPELPEGVRIVHVDAAASLADVRNAGLVAAVNDLVLLLDADDRALPARLEAQVQELMAHPESVLIASAVQLIAQDGSPLHVAFNSHAGEIDTRRLLQRNVIAQSSVILRRSAALEAGLYRDCAFCEDYDLWLRMARVGKLRALATPLVEYRVHESQITQGRRVPAEGRRRILESRQILARLERIGRLEANSRHLLWSTAQLLPARVVHPQRSASRTERTTCVVISGGLGNQLFQLAAVMAIAGPDAKELLPELGVPRRFDGSAPDLQLLPLTDDVRWTSLPKSGFRRSLGRKAIGYVQRIQVIPRGPERTRWFRWLVEQGVSAAVSVLVHRRVRVVGALGIGFPGPLALQSKKRVLVGYFQTWRYVSQQGVLEKLKHSLAQVEVPEFGALIQRAQEESPIIVHMRLGDYRNEERIGIPAAAYYTSAIKRVLGMRPSSSIWLFSDEPDVALQMIRSLENDARISVIESDYQALHPLQLLRIMSLGSAYVLSNSTFSWWAAMLSRAEAPPVLVPSPWFADGTVIPDLIPHDWIRLQRDSGRDV